MIVPVLEERLIVTRQLVLKEELRIRIGETRQHTTQSISLRREHADIDYPHSPGEQP
jgi:stress response protein YsnF